jgi:hypothetical protein
MRFAQISLLCLCTLGSACKKQPEPANSSPLIPAPSALLAPATPPAAGPAASAGAPVALTWEDPPAWKRMPGTSAMRKATYHLPRAAGDSADPELAVFYFGPGQGGGIDANIERWIKQFPDTKSSAVRREDFDANGLRVHTVEIEKGTFISGMPGDTQAKTGYGLLGGIVEAPSGAYFFKVTGPAASVKAARADFRKLLSSVKPS